MNPHSFTPGCKVQQPHWCGTGCVEMARGRAIRKVTSPITVVMAVFCQITYFYLKSSASAQWFWVLPQVPGEQRVLQLLWMVYTGPFQLNQSSSTVQTQQLYDYSRKFSPSLSAWLRDFQSFVLVGIVSIFF